MKACILAYTFNKPPEGKPAFTFRQAHIKKEIKFNILMWFRLLSKGIKPTMWNKPLQMH